jgi:pSer/pThr/pTyr-binding forkhead associated (FHA) protein
MTGDGEQARQVSTPAELKKRLEAERRGGAFLFYRDGEGKQAIVPLAGRQMTVGRREDNDVALEWDKQVSRLHAQIERIKGDWCLVDDGLSRNGSFVNSERISGKRRLADGDRLCFGATVMVYRSPPAAAAESTVGVKTSAPSVPLSETRRKVLIALARPVAESAFAVPATNQEIAEEVFLSVNAVKAHLRVLFEQFGLSDLPQNQKRATLAATALLNGVVAPHEL